MALIVRPKPSEFTIVLCGVEPAWPLCVIQYQTFKTQREWASPAVAQGTLVYTDDPAYAKSVGAVTG